MKPHEIAVIIVIAIVVLFSVLSLLGARQRRADRERTTKCELKFETTKPVTFDNGRSDASVTPVRKVGDMRLHQGVTVARKPPDRPG